MSVKIRIILAASLITLSGLVANAQRRLPAEHSQQHNSLIANQSPSVNPFKIENNSMLFNDIKEREELSLDGEIFSLNWESQSVNPYGNIEIPERHDIDVSDYVSPVPGYVTSNYGYRTRFRRNHYGIDLKLQIGDTVRCAFPGKVRLTKYAGRGYGSYVVVRHPYGMETVYGHLSRFLVKPNQTVKAGEAIALGGNTGRSTGPHLHFETRYLGIPINPAAIIDFENGVPHKDVFACDKRTNAKPQRYAPKKSTSKKKTYASKRKRSTRKK